MVPFAILLSLYSTLRPSLSVSAWVEQHSLDSKPIDVRRMIQFGVIKGFLRRVYAYPIWLDHPHLAPARHPSAGAPRRPSQAPSYPDTNLSQSTAPSPLPNQSMGSVDSSRPEYSARQASSSVFSSVASSVSNNDPTPIGALTPSGAGHIDAPARPQLRTALMTGMTASPRTGAPEGGATDSNGAALGGGVSYPPSLPLMMDGTHHTDEICIKYGVSLRQLEVVLKALGGADLQPVAMAEDGSQRRGSIPGYGKRLVMLYI